MGLSKEPPSSVTLLQAVIFLQFSASFFIVVLTTVGIAFSYPVASYYLMALLQVIVAVPGIVHIAFQGNIWVAIYISFQVVTSLCEIYWLIYMIFDNQPAGRWVGLAALTCVNIAAVVIALWFRNKELKTPCKKKSKKDEKKKKKKDDEKPKMRNASASMSEAERSNARSSRESSTSSKKVPSDKKDDSVSEKSSKGHLKVRKQKKNPEMPMDSRETSFCPRSKSSSSKPSDVESQSSVADQ